MFMMLLFTATSYAQYDSNSLLKGVGSSKKFSVGNFIKTNNVGPNGSFGHSIPLTILSGRNGMTPSVGINYSSTLTNGFLGVGWDLVGPSAIRCTSGNPAQVENEDQTCATTDLSLNINLNSVLMETSTPNVFFSRGGSNARVKYEAGNEYWVVDAGDGTKLYFGGDSSDNCTSSGNDCESFHAVVPNYTDNHGSPANIEVSAWLLYKKVDAYGNYIKYTYSNYSDGKDSRYLDQIEYTLHETTNSNYWFTMKFEWETRDDTVKSVNNIKRRLKAVKSYGKSNGSSIGTLFNTQHFEYHESPVSGRSRLYNVYTTDGSGTVQGQDNNIWWSNGGTNVSNTTNGGTAPSLFSSGNDPKTTTTDLTDFGSTTSRSFTGDFNGDGFDDLLLLEDWLSEYNIAVGDNSTLKINVFHGSATGLGANKATSGTVSTEDDTTSDGSSITWSVVDMNVDGYDDLIYFGVKEDIPYVKLYKGSSTGLNLTPGTKTFSSISSYNDIDIHYRNAVYEDMNEDGVPDLIFWRDALLNTGYHAGGGVAYVDHWELEVFTVYGDKNNSAGFSTDWIRHTNPGVEYVWGTEPSKKIGKGFVTDVDGDHTVDFCYATTGWDIVGTSPEYWGTVVNCAKFNGAGRQLTQDGNSFIVDFSAGNDTEYVRRRFVGVTDANGDEMADMFFYNIDYDLGDTTTEVFFSSPSTGALKGQRTFTEASPYDSLEDEDSSRFTWSAYGFGHFIDNGINHIMWLDVNGDGKQERVRPNLLDDGSWIIGHDSFGRDGSSYDASGSVSQWEPKDRDFEDHYLTGDWNGDGITDFARLVDNSYEVVPTSDEARLIFYIGQSDNQIIEEASFEFEIGAEDSQGYGTAAGDWNGDGATDVVVYHKGYPGSHETDIVQFLTTAGPVDLVTKIKNGLGGTIEITYAPTTDFSDAIKQTNQCNYYATFSGCGGINTNVSQLVQNIKTNSNSTFQTKGIISNKEYDYENQRFLANHGFYNSNTGFEKVYIRNVENQQLILTTFVQDPPYESMIEKSETFALQGSTDKLTSKKEHTFTTVTNHWGNTFPVVNDILVTFYNLGEVIRTHQTSMTFNNLGHITQTLSCSGGTSPYCNTTNREYTNINATSATANPYLLSRVTAVWTVSNSKLTNYELFKYQTNSMLPTETWRLYAETIDDSTCADMSTSSRASFETSACSTEVSAGKVKWIRGAKFIDYDVYGQLVESENMHGAVLKATYDGDYKAFTYTTVTENSSGTDLGLGVTREYDDFGLPEKTTDANGDYEEYVHDSFGRPKSSNHNGGSTLQQTVYTYGGELISNYSYASSFGNGYSRKWVDGFGEKWRVESTWDTGKKGYMIWNSFWDDGKLVRRRSNTSDDTTPEYWNETRVDSSGRVESVRFVQADIDDHAEVDYSILSEVQFARGTGYVDITNPLGTVVRQTYDHGGLLISKTEAYGTSEAKTVDFTRNAYGLITSISLPDGTSRTISYDSWGQTTQLKVVGSSKPNSGAIFTEYDFDNNKVIETSNSGDTITTLFDDVGRKKAKYDSTGDLDVTWDYYDNSASVNNRGKLKSVSYDDGSLTYTYNAKGLNSSVTEVIDGKSETLTFTYDAKMPIVVKETFSDGTYKEFDYFNGGHRLKSVKYHDGSSLRTLVTYDYNTNGSLKSASKEDGSNATYTYDVYGHLDNFNVKIGSDNIINIDFDYDTSGRLEDITDNRTSAEKALQANDTDATASYLYDKRSRLTQAVGPYGTINYEYDEIGDLEFKEGTETTYVSSTLIKGKQRSGFGSARIWEGTFDSDGNMTDLVMDLDGDSTNDYSWTAVYDPSRRVKSISGGSKTSAYAYGVGVNRIMKTYTSTSGNFVKTRYFFSGGLVHREDDASPTKKTSVTKSFSGADGLVATITENVTLPEVLSYADAIGQEYVNIGGTTHHGPPEGLWFYHGNKVTQVVIAGEGVNKGTEVSRTLFKPYGETMLSNSTGVDNFATGWAGPRDQEFDLMHLGARLYNPILGRFTAADAVTPGDGLQIDGYAQYSYAMGNPIGLSDSSGRDPGIKVYNIPVDPADKAKNDKLDSMFLSGSCQSTGGAHTVCSILDYISISPAGSSQADEIWSTYKTYGADATHALEAERKYGDNVWGIPATTLMALEEAITALSLTSSPLGAVGDAVGAAGSALMAILHPTAKNAAVLAFDLGAIVTPAVISYRALKTVSVAGGSGPGFSVLGEGFGKAPSKGDLLSADISDVFHFDHISSTDGAPSILTEGFSSTANATWDTGGRTLSIFSGPNGGNLTSQPIPGGGRYPTFFYRGVNGQIPNNSTINQFGISRTAHGSLTPNVQEIDTGDVLTILERSENMGNSGTSILRLHIRGHMIKDRLGAGGGNLMAITQEAAFPETTTLILRSSINNIIDNAVNPRAMARDLWFTIHPGGGGF